MLNEEQRGGHDQAAMLARLPLRERIGIALMDLNVRPADRKQVGFSKEQFLDAADAAIKVLYPARSVQDDDAEWLRSYARMFRQGLPIREYEAHADRLERIANRLGNQSVGGEK